MSVAQKITVGIGFLGVIILLWWLIWTIVYESAYLLNRLRARFPVSRVWARTHPLRAYFGYRYPRGYRFLAKRVDPNHPLGLPLTLGMIAATYVFSLIGGLVEELLEAEEMVAFDKAVNELLNAFRMPPFIEVFAWITTFGDSSTLIIVALVSTGFLWVHHRGHFILPLWMTFVGAQVTTYLGKFGFDRERPEFVTAVTAASPSFPSGHATGAMAVYGFIAYLIARDVSGLRARFEVVYWAAVVIALVGLSRLYLSVHYASDVATGFLVGGFWLLVGFMLAEHRRYQQTQR